MTSTQPAANSEVVRIVSPNRLLSLAIMPGLGGSLLEARWHDTLLTRPLPASLTAATVSHMTSFVMAPFANRIDAGRFTFEGHPIAVPINRAGQNVAIHGIARNRRWQVVAQLDNTRNDALELALTVDDPSYPFHFSARQHVQVSDAGWSMQLAVTNTGAASMPFGIGHHPYFRRTPDTVVTFQARGHFPTDAVRNLPTAPSGLPDAAQREHRLVAADSIGLDQHFYGWSGPAAIDWPDFGLTLEVSADRTLANAHIYFPPDEASVCVEPVSHVPDVHNHPEWAPYGALTVLRPGESLSGTLRCRIRTRGSSA